MLLNYLLVFLVSMVPLIELRGAVPIGVGLGLPELATLIIAIVGNMLPVPIIYLFARKVLKWGSERKWRPFKNFCNFCLKKGEKAGKKLLQKTGNSVYVALFLFVGIPVPGTGAWTGTLAAALLGLDFKKTIWSVLAGVLLAGIIMLALSFGFFKIVL